MTVGNGDIPDKFIEDKAEFLKLVADGLDNAERIQIGSGDMIHSNGERTIIEGWSVVQITDELAKQLSTYLREIAKDIKSRE